MTHHYKKMHERVYNVLHGCNRKRINAEYLLN